MKGTYPENIDQIGDFYRGKLQDGNIEPSASLWDSIELNLTLPDVSSASVSGSASTSAGNLLSFSMIWKGALIIGAAGVIAVAIVVNSKKEDDKSPLNENNSIENTNGMIGDTTVEARNNESVTEKGGVPKPLIQSEKNNQTEEAANEALPDNKIEPIVADTVIPTIAPAPVQAVEEKEKEKEEKPKAKEKEAEAKPGNFFERKLKQQKDTSSHLFKPNK